MRKHILQVVPDRSAGCWRLIHISTNSSRHRTQARAVAAGRRLARREKTDLTVWGTNGRIRSKDSYGNESSRSDTEH